jgi:hypothetical protein
MRYSFALLLVVSLLCLPPAAAQTNQSAPSNATQQIANDLRLVESGYDAETGEAWVVLEAEHPTAVTLSDGGALHDGSGEIASRSVVVEGQTEVRVSVTEVNGRVGVIIGTDATLYGHVIETSSNLIGGPFTGRDVQTAAVSGFVIVAIVSLVMVVRYLRNSPGNPERIA